MMLLANENFPLSAVEGLRAAGHDVLWARTDLPGAPDDVILERAQREDRLIATFDKDFGELAFRWGLPATSGVILFRLHALGPEHLRNRIVKVLSDDRDWKNAFSVVDEYRTRVRILPR